MPENKEDFASMFLKITNDGLDSIKSSLSEKATQANQEADRLNKKVTVADHAVSMAGSAGLGLIGSVLSGLVDVTEGAQKMIKEEFMSKDPTPQEAPVTDPVTTTTTTQQVNVTTTRVVIPTKKPTPEPAVKGDSLSRKVALVTGSTSGIGLEIAKHLASLGASVIVTGLGDPTEIDNLVHDLEEQYNVPVAYIPSNLSVPESIESLYLIAKKKFGGIDILVNNAGIQHVAKVEDFPIEKWNDVIAINLTASFLTTKYVVPDMKKHGWGRIINISSVHGLVASPQKSAYVASKHGIIGFTKSVALEVANDGITVNAICPGWVLTPMVEKQIQDRATANKTTVEQETFKLLDEKQPMKKFSTTEHIAHMVAYLCSPYAETITGTTLTIDGGWTAE